jgi:hypothetical protein
MKKIALEPVQKLQVARRFLPVQTLVEFIRYLCARLKDRLPSA